MGIVYSGQLRPPAPTLTEANLGPQTGKVFVITGGTSGVGLELAKILYNAGGTVFVTGRSQKTVQAAITEVKASTPQPGNTPGVIDGVDLDLSDLSTIKAKAQILLEKAPKIDVLQLNAGVMVPPADSKSAQGLELQMGVNCVAHLLLAHLLTPALVAAAQQAAANNAAPGSVRVVWAGSLAVDVSPKGGLEMSAVKNPPRAPNANYIATKVGNWFLANYFAELPAIKENNILNVAQNPGNLRTNLQRHLNFIQDFLVGLMLYPSVYGAYTELWAAVSDELSIQDQGSFVLPWGRKHPKPRPDLVKAIEGGKAREFGEWCEEQIREFR